MNATTGGEGLPDAATERHILVVLSANGGYDRQLVRESLQVAVEQGRLRTTDEGYMVAEGGDAQE